MNLTRPYKDRKKERRVTEEEEERRGKIKSQMLSVVLEIHRFELEIVLS